MARVLIESATYETIGAAVERAFALFPTAVAGRRVLIKPNALRAARPEEAITTHPALLSAVVEKVESLHPAEIVVGDNPGSYGDGTNEQVFWRSGLWAAAGGHYRDIGRDSLPVATPLPYAPTLEVSQAVLEADILISLPKFKTHGLTVLTGAIKNSFGILTGHQKSRLHGLAGGGARFQEMLVEVFRLRVPDLVLIDAVVAMEGNGPTSDDLREIGVVLASDDAVALDTVMAVMAGCDPARLPILRRAAELGLGENDLERIGIVGRLEPVPGFRLPSGCDGIRLGAGRLDALIDARSALRPRVDPDRCTACGACVAQCPADALSLPGATPLLHSGCCIACFCCQEICPEKAIVLGAAPS